MADQSTITVINVSRQTIQILVKSIGITEANPDSQLAPGSAGLFALQPTHQLRVEVDRVSHGQLFDLRNLNLISYTRPPANVEIQNGMNDGLGHSFTDGLGNTLTIPI